MKKFILCISAIMCLSLVCFTNCKSSDYSKQIEYQVAVTGQSNGSIDVKFPHGTFTTKGSADIILSVNSNDSLILSSNNVKSLESALESKNNTEHKAALRVNTELNKISVSKAEGKYFINIKGFVKEPITGFIFAIDRTFTNKDSVSTY